ncbi:DUF4232 domain-containing protein [Saccharopolyspora gloriosae]|uniref:DUF4232 domain-containing protein n=1 Tax=Saccharopolyspora gloriosae TaxID=455344 RepID=UPI001FB58E7E|nr:DUF4232 domain-containing protein [Saccharopolyspora gloriosae]
MIANIRRAAAIAATVGAVAGASLLSAGSALANPSDVACGAADVNVAVTKEQGGAAGHEAFLISYTAANPQTNCKLQGAPGGVVFTAADGPISDVSVAPDGGVAEPVNLTASSPAHSYLIQATGDAPHAAVPGSVELDLPSPAEGQDTREVAAWPANEPIKGDVLQVTPVTQG